MSLRSAIRLLVVLALALPVVVCALVGVARGLLAALGDERGANVATGAGQIATIGWLVSLAGLVIVLGLNALQEPPSDDDEK